MSFNRRMDEQSVIHLYFGIYPEIKRNELSSHKKTWRNIKCILLSES
jgi:hypothetical protein